jgi:hypothetical protein
MIDDIKKKSFDELHSSYQQLKQTYENFSTNLHSKEI